jgi:phosphocarrier protein
MIKFKAKVPFDEGLHARPATQLVNLIKNVASDVKLVKGDTSVNPKSILGVLTVGATHGDELEIVVEGDDEEAVAKNLKEFFQVK